MKIGFASAEDKTLFMKYAVPCGMTLVRRGDVAQDFLDDLREKTIAGDLDDVDPEETFKIAVRMCYLTAKKLGRKKIDASVIREYFWREHEEAVKWRSEVFKDVSIETCRVYPGRVISVGPRAVVKTPVGEAEFNIAFVPDLNKGDFVVTHYDHVIEKTDPATATRLGLSP